ncbi:hypothetical protein [Inquilinus limosus]|uniref:Uncharacterized protein n=1 Tax=Inquilinus limosus MP06 TaxID=1398085 RepID=A0A0A0DAF3_9PROT|nr:hypothetical protein [Inquilinus limosus]KGM35701.1 hypothetical protein P409_02965 [Inquilinus limosus MP06]
MFNWILANWDGILATATAVVTAASMIAALTPTPADDSAVAILRKVIDFLALNIGHAKKP